MLPSRRTLPASTQSAQAFVSVSFDPASGESAIYTVAASVVVTEALDAANVGRWKLCAVQAVAVPDPAVALSVYVFAAQLVTLPVVLGVPALLPGVKAQATLDVDCAVVTPAASSVCAYPSQSKEPDKGEIKDEALSMMF
jgi:hypothetical protein